MELHKRTLTKTITWRVLAVLITYLFVASHPWAVTGAILINAVKTAAYYVHERVWNTFSWQRTATETALRSATKTLSWKLITTIITAVILYFYFASWSQAITISLGINATKLIFYYLHERVWTHISWAKNH